MNDTNLKKEFREDAIDRFENIMKLLSASLKKTADHTDDDFAKAIEATEIYQTYKKCFN